MNVSLLASNNALPNGYVFVNYPFNLIGTIPANTENYVLEYSVSSTHPKYIYVTWGDFLTNIVVERQITGLNSSIDKNNDLQQESNQLQQEQNDILTNDEVNTDDLQFAQDNTNNPTSEGFNTLFMTIYNAFCNSTSSPLTVTLPFINQTFTISPNLVSQGMEKMRTWFNC